MFPPHSSRRNSWIKTTFCFIATVNAVTCVTRPSPTAASGEIIQKTQNLQSASCGTGAISSGCCSPAGIQLETTLEKKRERHSSPDSWRDLLRRRNSPSVIAACHGARAYRLRFCRRCVPHLTQHRYQITSGANGFENIDERHAAHLAARWYTTTASASAPLSKSYRVKTNLRKKVSSVDAHVAFIRRPNWRPCSSSTSCQQSGEDGVSNALFPFIVQRTFVQQMNRLLFFASAEKDIQSCSSDERNASYKIDFFAVVHLRVENTSLCRKFNI